jgi:hypothetical protein
MDRQVPGANEGDPPQIIYTFPGELILQDTTTLARTVIPVSDVMLDLSSVLFWSPDGTLLFFTVHCNETLEGIWRLDIDMQALERLVDCHDGRIQQPQVSPDGAQVLFRADWDGGWDIYVVEVATGSIHNLTGE